MGPDPEAWRRGIPGRVRDGAAGNSSAGMGWGGREFQCRDGLGWAIGRGSPAGLDFLG
ncbi:hypothetical protein RMHFA_05622 [Roseomonas mucosa]|nr:hypothetical protein RMHFA_05622 [Roseomonas mucosa]